MMNIRQYTLLCLLALTWSGCASMKAYLPKKKRTHREIKAAIATAEKEKKLDELRTACKTGKMGEDDIKYHRTDTCKATGRLMAEEMATVDCKEITTYWENAKKMNSKIKEIVYDAYGLRAAACDKWGIVFEDLMHWGQLNKGAMGYKLLVKIADAPLPLESKFLEYLKTQTSPLNSKNSWYAMAHYIMWRADQNKGESCGAYATSANKLNAGGQHYMLQYFNIKNCKDGISLALRSLAAENPDTRSLACRYLGKHGEGKHIKKLSVLAGRDGYRITRNYRVVYPVRDTCNNAIAKIKVRQ